MSRESDAVLDRLVPWICEHAGVDRATATRMLDAWETFWDANEHLMELEDDD